MTDNEILNKLLEKESGPFDFDGNNCSDVDGSWNDGMACGGWDGESRRCGCGNRRVTWVLSDCKTYIYGEAY